MTKTTLQKAIPAALLIAVVAALYGQFLWNPIVFDDLYFFVVDNAGEQPVSSYHFAWLQLRSLPYATLAWTKAWFGLDLINFRIGNLILHAAVCCALYGFLNSLFSALMPGAGSDIKEGVESNQLAQNTLALIAALLFALHPVATYAAGYLVQRTILFATLFSLLALWTWVQGSSRQNSLWFWFCVPLYYLAVFSKEHAVMLIAVLPLLTILLHPDWRNQLRQQLGVFAALAAIAGFAVLSHKGILGSVYEINGGEMLAQTDAKLSYPLSVLTQMGLFFKYLMLWLLPNPAWMSIDMREPFASEIAPLHILSALAYLAWGASGFWLLLKRGSQDHGHLALLGFAMLFPWLLFMTEFSTVRIQESFVLYRSYLWAVGALVALPWAIQRLPVRAVIAMAVLGVVVLFPLSMERLATLSHPVLLWEDAKKLLAGRNDLPGASRIYYNLGTEYIKIDRPDKAIPELKLAAELNPNFAEAFGNLGAAYFKQANWNAAVASFSQAIAVDVQKGKPAGVRNLLGRAQAYENAGDIPKSQADFQESCRLAQRGCDKIR
jgi:tetratricopeptide (TPR) repeat protein